MLCVLISLYGHSTGKYVCVSGEPFCINEGMNVRPRPYAVDTADLTGCVFMLLSPMIQGALSLIDCLGINCDVIS
jgi:hypothetical protein